VAYKEIDKRLSPDFYQDIIDLGGLDNAINGALNSVGSKLEVGSSMELPFLCSKVEYKERFSQIMLAANERWFSADLWCDGICYGGWWFKDLIQVADFIKHFVESQLSVKEMRKAFAWFDSQRGELHEKDAKKETKQEWEDMIRRLEKEKDEMKYLFPCVKIAKEIAELAALFPYTSLNTLCFSLTTGYPYLPIGPKITAREGYIEVKFGENESKKIQSTSELKKYIKQNVVRYGSARQGTAESIRDDKGPGKSLVKIELNHTR
jgi:DNA-binding transcriptional MerR regulator